MTDSDTLVSLSAFIPTKALLWSCLHTFVCISLSALSGSRVVVPPWATNFPSAAYPKLPPSYPAYCSMANDRRAQPRVLALTAVLNGKICTLTSSARPFKSVWKVPVQIAAGLYSTASVSCCTRRHRFRVVLGRACDSYFKRQDMAVSVDSAAKRLYVGSLPCGHVA